MSKKIETRSFEKLNMRVKALIKNESVNVEKRTAELTWSTGAKGLRRSWFGSYYEELDMSEKSIDLSRLNGGAPLLKSHEAHDIDSVIGVVERAWLENGEGKAIVRFAEDAASEVIFQKVRSGILKNISVGYDVGPDGYEDVSGDDDEIPTLRATSWEPLEVSIVSIGFDKKAQIRSKEELTENEIKEIKVQVKTRVKPTQEKQTMDEAEKQRIAAEAEKTRLANEKALADAVAAEKTRGTEIRRLVKEAGFKDELAQEYIERNQSIEQVKTNVELFKKHAVETRVASTTSFETTNAQDLTEGFTDMLLNRVMPSEFKVTEKSKAFHGQSVMRSLEAVIERRRMESDIDYAKRVMTTSDLPLILANVAEKTAQKRYDLAEKTFSIWTGSGELKDFKPKSQVRAGDIGELKERNEAGEFEESNLGEEAESAQLKQYGVTHAFSDVMLINDDLDLIMQVANETGVAVARLENKLAYNILKDNANMSDGFALFSTEHGNLGASPGAIGETTFAEAYLKMRTQKSVDERDTLNITPKFLVVPPSLEVEARKFLTTIIPNQTSNVNVFSNSVQLVVDAELTDDKYYFIADPSRIDGVKIFRLRGQQGAKVSSRVNWRTDSIELKISHAVGAKALDYRGMFRNEKA